jgi:hypothetical protein
MAQPGVAGPLRRDPLFLSLCLFALLIAEVSQRGAFIGAQIHRWNAVAMDGQLSFEWTVLGPILGGIVAFLAGRHLGLGVGGGTFFAGVGLLMAAPYSLIGYGLFVLGAGLLVVCLLSLAAVWLPNERGNARLAFFFLMALGTEAIMTMVPAAVGTGEQGSKFILVAFAGLALVCALGVAALDFWAGRGVDKPRSEEPRPSRPQLEAIGLLTAAGILAHAALGCAFRQQQEAMMAWQNAGQPLTWLYTMTGVLTIALLLVGMLLALMGTFMGLGRLGVAAAIPVALSMAAIAVLCGSFLAGSQEPMVAIALFSAMASGFLQMSLIPILSAIAGGVPTRWAPLALGLYLGIGAMVGRFLGEALAGGGNAFIFPFVFLLIAAGIGGHFLGRHADKALAGEAPAA